MSATSNGWHAADVTCTSAATGTTTTYRVSWRTQRVECCGQSITIADAHRPPVLGGRTSYGRPHETDQTVQCGGCGTRYAPVYGAMHVEGVEA